MALRGISEDWAIRHRDLIPPNDRITPLADAPAEEVATLTAWLATKVGAPRLARGKMVLFQFGCLGCHRRGAHGGDIGPELTFIGDKDVRDLSDDRADSGTLAAWLLKHVLAPQDLDPESQMPPLDTEELDRESDPDDLATYLLSLRDETIPNELTPPDRAKVTFGLGRDFPTTGRGLYVTFCSSCHGVYASGREIEILHLVTPMIGTRGHLTTVTPRYIRDTILRGRRGRYMPAWGPEDGGLTELEIDAIVDYLGAQGFAVPDYETLTGTPDRANGQRVFEHRCAACHTPQKTEVVFGRDLLADGALRDFSGFDLYGAVMRGWVEEGMPSFAFLERADVRDLLAYLGSDSAPPPEETVEHDGLHPHFGHQIWQTKCGDCHGPSGEGGRGPMINTGPYLEWASDDYLLRRTLHHEGRVATSMIGSLSDDDLDALLDYIRGWSGRVAPPPPPEPEPEAVTNGQRLFASRCPECHGQYGEGKTGPALANRDFLDLVSRPFLVMTILEGRKGTPMQGWRDRHEMPVTLEEAFDLADYIVSLRTPRPSSTHKPGKQQSEDE